MDELTVQRLVYQYLHENKFTMAAMAMSDELSQQQRPVGSLAPVSSRLFVAL